MAASRFGSRWASPAPPAPKAPPTWSSPVWWSLDHWGVIKADVGIRDGRITALGHAGNPETMDGIHPDLVIGPSTEVMAGNGLIMTAGTVDTHVHYVQPDMLEEALAAGTTTVVGGGHRPDRRLQGDPGHPGAVVDRSDARGV